MWCRYRAVRVRWLSATNAAVLGGALALGLAAASPAAASLRTAGNAGTAGSSRPVSLLRTFEPSLAPVQQGELMASDGTENRFFARSVAISADGTTAVLGTNERGTGRGVAYVFTWSGSGWQQSAELTASDGATGDRFGVSVAISADGDTILVGAPGRPYGGGTGGAYVFTRSGPHWVQSAELIPGNAAGGEALGWSVSISADGNTALMGAYGRDGNTGAAWVFTRSWRGWEQSAELTASDGVSGDFFGISVAISADGDTAIVGAYARDSSKGAAYVFTRSWRGWQQSAELTASDGVSGNEFGASVAISGDGTTAIVGAASRHFGEGAAYVFNWSLQGWRQSAELTARDAVDGQGFGSSVAIAADTGTVLIGSSGLHSGTGGAYLFTWSGAAGWRQSAELTASDGADNDQFGSSVAISAYGDTELIGAPQRDSDTGAGYVFTIPFTIPFGL